MKELEVQAIGKPLGRVYRANNIRAKFPQMANC